MNSASATEPTNPASSDPLASRLPSLLKICERIGAGRDLAALFDLLARDTAKLLEADRASIFLLDREKSELWSIASQRGKEIRFDARLGIAGAAALSGQTINIEDAQHDPRFNPKNDARTGYRTRSVLAVPLRNPEGHVSGTFQVLNKKKGVFTTEDEQLLQALVTQAAPALETAQMVEQLKQHGDRLREENELLRKQVEGRFATHKIIGSSEKIQQIVRLIEQISESNVDVLITGESGTGKEMAAKAIHNGSLRTRRSLVALNCAALPENLVESELFGIEKGVATGVEARIGKFEEASGGTLFLDEIGDLSLVAQAKILRVLQERVVERVGGRKLIPVDVRILAATNKDLEAEAKKGAFRGDLFYRLNVVHIRIPPLREIRDDVPLLASYFLDKYCREMQKPPMRLSAGAIATLTNYRWPGNVRELENEMKRAAVITPRSTVTEANLSESVRAAGTAGAPSHSKPHRTLKEAITELEIGMIREALEASGKNQQRTAKALGLSRQGLIKKMKRYEIR